MSATTSATQSELFVNEPITDSPVRVRPASRGFVRYVLAICIGVAATLAWQSYGQTAKRIIATRVPELGWSPETKQTIATWVEQLGWTKLPTSSDAAARPSLPETAEAATVAQTAPDKVAPRMPIAGSVDPQQIQQIARDIAGLRQSVEQVVASQTFLFEPLYQTLFQERVQNDPGRFFDFGENPIKLLLRTHQRVDVLDRHHLGILRRCGSRHCDQGFTGRVRDQVEVEVTRRMHHGIV